MIENGVPNHRSDGEATKRKIYDAAIASFRSRGVEKTSMRLIAKDADVSVGATYHYFPSKQAIILNYYETHQRSHASLLEAQSEPTTSIERLSRVFHTKLEMLIEDRKILVGYAAGHVDPTNSTSLFSADTARFRNATLDMFKHALRDEPLTPNAMQLTCMALWALEKGILLYFVQDDSEDAAKSHELVDGAIETLFPLMQLSASPMLNPVLENGLRILANAGLTQELND